MGLKRECDRCGYQEKHVPARDWGTLTLYLSAGSQQKIDVCPSCVYATRRFMDRQPTGVE